MGLEVARERPGEGRGYFGFDYDDEEAVAAQLERLRAEVEKYKDHPALIIWGIGNELNLGATNPRVWDAVNGISEMIHEVDPNHLTTTMLAGVSRELVDEIKTRAPDLDLLSVQMYAGYRGPAAAHGRVRLGRPLHGDRVGSDRALGSPSDALGRTHREHQLRQGGFLSRALPDGDRLDTTQLLGSYVFLWGQKQERTPTWYGLFLPPASNRSRRRDALRLERRVAREPRATAGVGHAGRPDRLRRASVSMRANPIPPRSCPPTRTATS
jgi:hypothetical protein